MTYDEALSYIHRIHWQFCIPGLERVRELCEKLGNPQDKLHFVHVAGTNGKGSFCAMLASVLQCAGYRVGLFTSPYIQRFNERMMLNGQAISDEELAALTEEVRPYADAMSEPPTEFELITAIAFLYFARHGCDLVVLECGMGGRLDATNLIQTPILSVITGIALDHTRYLGDTVEAIANEKAGIIKSGVPVLYGGDDRVAADVIRKRAQEANAPYFETDHRALRIDSMTLTGTVFTYCTDHGVTSNDYGRLFLPLLGEYQPANAANVLEAISILRGSGLSVSKEAVQEGLRKTVWRARFELLATDPIVIIDGAHNPQGICAAVCSIRRYFGTQQVLMLGGVMADKAYRQMACELAPCCAEMFAIRPNNPRALDEKTYAQAFLNIGVTAHACESVHDGVFDAIALAKKSGLPLVCLGSLYQYADVREQVLLATQSEK